VQTRLLATDSALDTGETIIEPAHEALLRQWGALQDWLNEDSAALLALKGIRQAARDWAANAKAVDWLGHSAGRLEDAERLGQREDFSRFITPVEQAYLQACCAHEKEDRNRELEEARKLAEAQKKIAQRTRLGLIAASVLAGAAILLLAVAGWQWWLAKNGTISALIQTSEAQFNSGEDWDALMTSLRAAQLLRTIPLMKYFDQDIRSHLSQSVQQALYSVREYKRLKYGEKGTISRQSALGQIDWSPDGKSLAFVSGPDEVTSLIPDSNSRELIHRNQSDAQNNDEILSLGWKPPNGETLATSSRNGRIEFFDLQSKQFLPSVETGDQGLYGIRPLDTFHIPTVMGGVRWSPDGQVLATLDHYGLVRLWKDNPLLKKFIAPALSQVNDAALSPDGKILAFASGQGITLWREDQFHKWLLEPNSLPSRDAKSLSWSPDGQFLASTAFDAVTIWNRDGTLKKSLRDARVGNGILTVSWHPNGRTIAGGDGNAGITFWDINNGSVLSRFVCEPSAPLWRPRSNDWVQSIEWNPVDERFWLLVVTIEQEHIDLNGGLIRRRLNQISYLRKLMVSGLMLPGLTELVGLPTGKGWRLAEIIA
jgi:WD40 repeat protein